MLKFFKIFSIESLFFITYFFSSYGLLIFEIKKFFKVENSLVFEISFKLSKFSLFFSEEIFVVIKKTAKKKLMLMKIILG